MTSPEIINAMAVLIPALAGAIVMASKEIRQWITMSRNKAAPVVAGGR